MPWNPLAERTSQCGPRKFVVGLLGPDLVHCSYPGRGPVSTAETMRQREHDVSPTKIDDPLELPL
ncbi:hypothetical protein WAI453_007440 [Rhynchosporium graminicola]